MVLSIITKFYSINFIKIKSIKFTLNPIPYGLFNKPKVMGGGQICPP